ncbi:MAG: hypothetical protein M0D55_18000 [Elusimicrobiota bacterium]|nr:MAG: hypothetical protein M0D55_18000 [Elusimicrobiota bacterium]
MSWIFKIAHNAAADAARRGRSAPAGEGEFGLDVFAEGRPGPAAEFERGMSRGRVEDAIGALPEEQKAVFLMREHGGMSFKEIAAAQGVPLGTALSRMNAALVKLRAALQEEESSAS